MVFSDRLRRDYSGYCDPFDYPMHAADRIDWRMNRSNHNDTDLIAAQEAYKTGFETALEVGFPLFFL